LVVLNELLVRTLEPVPLVTPPRLDPTLLPDELLRVEFGTVDPARLSPVPVLVLTPEAEVPSAGEVEVPTVPTPGVVMVPGDTVVDPTVVGAMVVVGVTAVGETPVGVTVVGLTVGGITDVPTPVGVTERLPPTVPVCVAPVTGVTVLTPALEPLVV